MTKRKVNTQRKLRTCLKCGRKFMSEGPGHRICPKKCAPRNAVESGLRQVPDAFLRADHRSSKKVYIE